jgi:hypothetical protein
MGHAVAWLVEELCKKEEGRVFNSQLRHWIYSNIPNPFELRHDPGIDSSFNRNEYQISSLGEG